MADQQNSLQGKSVMPSLTVNNLQESEKFFSALGFEIEDRFVVVDSGREVRTVVVSPLTTLATANLRRK